MAAVAACIALSGYAEAGDQTITVRQAVSTVGVDLNTLEGARKVYRQLQSAARDVCSNTKRLDLLPQLFPASCYEDALGNAIRSANSPQLTMVYLRSHSLDSAEAHGINLPATVVARK